MKRIYRYIIIFAILVIAASAGVTASAVTARAAKKDKITTTEEFYDAFARQIYDREAFKYYDVENSSLMDSLYHLNLEDFACHYNPDEPLLSGCYLVYYIDTVYTTYDSQGLKVMITFPYPKGNMDDHFDMMARLAQRLKGETDYDTVLNVHDYLIENFEYDHRSSMENHTDIDGFKDGVMVCSGYGLAAYYLLNEAGVETRIITGIAGGGLHMWNMVKLEDKWYNLDVTWDDMGDNYKIYKYFLKSDADFPDHKRTGGYTASNFNVMVSQKSYKHPFYFGRSAEVLIGVIFLILLAVIYFKYIHGSKRKPEAVPTTAVVVDDFDDWMKEQSDKEEQNL